MPMPLLPAMDGGAPQSTERSWAWALAVAGVLLALAAASSWLGSRGLEPCHRHPVSGTTPSPADPPAVAPTPTAGHQAAVACRGEAVYR
jgi:hypothetical protein